MKNFNVKQSGSEVILEEVKEKDTYGIKVGDRVRFNYIDEETEKEVTGVGRVTEIDHDRNISHSKEFPTFYIQTTRKLHYYYGPNLEKL